MCISAVYLSVATRFSTSPDFPAVQLLGAPANFSGSDRIALECRPSLGLKLQDVCWRGVNLELFTELNPLIAENRFGLLHAVKLLGKRDLA